MRRETKKTDDVKWIRIVTDIFDNRKIKQIESLPNGDSIIVIWLKILTLAGSINDSGFVYFTKEIPYTDQLLATAFNRPLATVQFALDIFQKFEMIEVVNDMIFISNWEKYQCVEGLSKIREQNRLRKQRQREKQKALAESCHVTVTGRHATELEIEEEIEDKDLSISDEIDCCTDVQRVVNAWNAIDGLPKIIKLEPESKRGQMLGARIKQYGIDQVIRAIESVPNSSFLMGKTKKQFKLTFDWLVKPNNFPKVLEGNYLDENKTVYAPDSEPYRGAKYLAKLLRKRMPTLPEYTEETLQKWAAALDELHGEGHEWDEISDVMNLSQNSDFWQRQICDAYALKRKYVNLLADLQRG
jgi:predicted phage replisome organizer